MDFNLLSDSISRAIDLISKKPWTGAKVAAAGTASIDEATEALESLEMTKDYEILEEESGDLYVRGKEHLYPDS